MSLLRQPQEFQVRRRGRRDRFRTRGLGVVTGVGVGVGVGVGTSCGGVMNGSRVALGAPRDTSQRIPKTSAATPATSVAPMTSRRVLLLGSWGSDTGCLRTS